MTAVLAVSNGEKSVLFSDSLGSGGDSKGFYGSKIVSKKRMSLAFSGTYMMGRLFEHRLSEVRKKHLKSGEDVFLHDTFLTQLMEWVNDDLTEKHNLCCVVAFKGGRVFRLQSDLAYLESEDGVESAGSGGERVECAFKMAVMMHTGCGAKNLKEGIRSLTTKEIKVLGRQAFELAYTMCPSIGGEIHTQVI